VQHWFVTPPLTPQSSPALQPLVHVIWLPVHGSVYVPPHCPGGHAFAGVQHWFPVPHTSPPLHWFEQVNWFPVHGSV
jgi:hypothetical protein